MGYAKGKWLIGGKKEDLGQSRGWIYVAGIVPSPDGLKGWFVWGSHEGHDAWHAADDLECNRREPMDWMPNVEYHLAQPVEAAPGCTLKDQQCQRVNRAQSFLQCLGISECYFDVKFDR